MLNSAMLRIVSSDWNAEQSLAMLMIKHLNATKATNIVKGGKSDKGNYWTDQKMDKISSKSCCMFRFLKH